ncbi:MAG: GFA family protein [Silicimonas sp.]|nr:GFA family protein [Silicimonas sp.]
MSQHDPIIAKHSTGRCLCGAVAYAAATDGRFSICYCKMCQRWAAGVFMSAPTTAFKITQGADKLHVTRTSDWAERAFCTECGSNIYYKADMMETPAVAFGSLDDTSGFTPRIQFFSDKKPEGLPLVPDTKTMTEAECNAAFAPDPGETS